MNKTFQERAQIQHEKILRLVSAAYDTGYYAAILERAPLTEAERDEYRELQTEALARRTEASLALEVV